MTHQSGEIVSPWGIPCDIGMWSVRPYGVIIWQERSVRMFSVRSRKSFGIFILDMDFNNILMLIESNAALMSRERIHSSSFLSLEVLYIELSIWRGWKVPWLGRPAKLFPCRILWEQKIVVSLLVRILVKIFRKESIKDIGLVSWRLNFHSIFLLIGYIFCIFHWSGICFSDTILLYRRWRKFRRSG